MLGPKEEEENKGAKFEKDIDDLFNMEDREDEDEDDDGDDE